MDLTNFDPSIPDYFEQHNYHDYFARLRAEDPVHYCVSEAYGPYWSVTRYKDIVEVDTNHQVFSSLAELGGINLADEITIDQKHDFKIDSFFTMDPPEHEKYRKAVVPITYPASIAELEGLIRVRTQTVLDNLPVGEEFDWVERVSIELTTQMLATLFDFPFEERRKLTRWSDVVTAEEGAGIVDSQEARIGELKECLAYFTELWNQRVNQPPKFDFISMLANDPDTREMTPELFLGHLILLIVGGNDTTRNSMSGGIYGMYLFPEQRQLLNENPDLLDNAIKEIIRWQTPICHMRRTALADYELGGKQIKKGDKVAMWYCSGNRDEEVFPKAGYLDIKRPNAARHLSFGSGVHRCMGQRLAELQLRILWQEILKRWDQIEVVSEPRWLRSNIANSITEMRVKLP